MGVYIGLLYPEQSRPGLKSCRDQVLVLLLLFATTRAVPPPPLPYSSAVPPPWLLSQPSFRGGVGWPKFKSGLQSSSSSQGSQSVGQEGACQCVVNRIHPALMTQKVWTERSQERPPDPRCSLCFGLTQLRINHNNDAATS